MENNTCGWGIVALVLGIVGLFIFGLPLGIAACIVGCIGISQDGRKWCATTGMILGIFNVLFSIAAGAVLLHYL